MNTDALDAAARAVDELRRLQDRRRELRDNVHRIDAEIAALRSSRQWQVLERYRRARIKAGIAGARLLDLRASWRARTPNRSIGRLVQSEPLGVNVAGYLDTESGMGEAARASIRALTAAGVPLALNSVPSSLRTADASFGAAFTSANPHPFNLVHLNADNMPAFAVRRGRGYFKGRYTIGYWFWELETFRDEWVSCAGYVDEVWTATRFIQQSVAAKCRIVVQHLAVPVVLPVLPPHGRAHFNLPDGPFVFLYIFDVSSQTERKNPIAAVQAFRRAALPHDAAVLVLKFTNPEYDRAGVRRLHEEARGLNVIMLDGYLDRPDLCALMNAADCYLSPHRSEGLGLTLLESMRLGKPVIGTAYSGNMDFMTEDNSYLLDYRLVTLARDYGPYMAGAQWAEPDVDRAAALIRHVVEHRDDARARGERARLMVERVYSPEVTGTAMRARLDAIRAGHRDEAQR